MREATKREKLLLVDVELKEIRDKVTAVVRQQSEIQEKRDQLLTTVILEEELLCEGSWELRVARHPVLFCKDDMEFPKLMNLLEYHGGGPFSDVLKIGPCNLLLDDGELWLSAPRGSLEEFDEFLTNHNIRYTLHGVEKKVTDLEDELSFYRMMKSRFGE